MNKNLFISGMFRSGTTLMARMINSHPNICLASDPYAPIFKCYRNEIASKIINIKHELNAPLNDYFNDKNQLKVFNEIQNKSFDIPLFVHNIKEIRNLIEIHAKPYSPLIIPYLNKLNGLSYKELIDSGIQIVQKAYGKGNDHWVGIKEVWTNEFSPHFLKSFKFSKVILINRDPRAVVASNFSTKTRRYPFLFLCRQWRKLADLSFKFKKLYPKNVLVLKFEDIVSNPVSTSKKICSFLEIPYFESISNIKELKDGSNNSWTQNSSYNISERKFNQKSLEKWKEILNPNQIKYIEALCINNMDSLGYEPCFSTNKEEMINSINSFIEEERGIAEWIRKYNYSDYEAEKCFEINFLKNNK